MAEGNPMLMLERGEKAEMPPAIWHQARGDILHDYKDETRARPTPRRRASARATRRPAATSSCATSTATAKPGHSPDLTKIGDTFQRMLAFIGKHGK